MKKYIILIFCLLLCLFVLAGCICKHTWIDADCIHARICVSCGKTEGEPMGHTWIDARCTAAKTCSVCGATEGEPLPHTWIEANCTAAKTCSVCEATEGKPLGHTIVQRLENPDVIAATVHQEEYCSACNEQISSGTVPLSTMVLDGKFLFTPNEFMERLAIFTDKYVHDISCDFVLSDTGLAAFVVDDEAHQIVMQFFGQDATPLTVAELDSAEVWCVSLTETGIKNTKLWQSFFMACDPALDTTTAYRINVGVSAAFQNSAFTGEVFGYVQYNDLLYETAYVAADIYGEYFMMDMINIYASDFRVTEEETIVVLRG